MLITHISAEFWLQCVLHSTVRYESRLLCYIPHLTCVLELSCTSFELPLLRPFLLHVLLTGWCSLLEGRL